MIFGRYSGSPHYEKPPRRSNGVWLGEGRNDTAIRQALHHTQAGRPWPQLLLSGKCRAVYHGERAAANAATFLRTQPKPSSYTYTNMHVLVADEGTAAPEGLLMTNPFHAPAKRRVKKA